MNVYFLIQQYRMIHRVNTRGLYSTSAVEMMSKLQLCAAATTRWQWCTNDPITCHHVWTVRALVQKKKRKRKENYNMSLKLAV